MNAIRQMSVFELKDRMDKQIRDMDIRGSAWGLVNPASMGKSATSTMDGLRLKSYNSWDQSNSAEDAEVFFGLPMSFNAGLSLTF